mgnify:FL=1
MRPALLALLASVSATASADDFPVSVDTADHKVVVEQVLTGLSIPWGIAFLPDGNALVTERPGSVSLVDLAAGTRVELKGVPGVAAENQGGMLDVQIAPSYATDGWVYLCYSIKGMQGLTTRISRHKLVDSELTDKQVLFTAEPFMKTVHHFGCRLQFDGKGHVFFGIGDRQERHMAQKLTSDNGKMHRINEDGTIPADNPFKNADGKPTSIWSYGHRNPQGVAFQPGTGELFVTEHGPRGGDEVNIIRRGENFGWPVITYGREYHGPSIGEGTHKDGMLQPAFQWTPSIGPSGLVFYSGPAFPKWNGNLLAGGMALTYLSRLTVNGEQVEEVEKLFEGRGWRIRDVEQGSDGNVYLLTDNGWLLRVRPE